MMFIVYIDDDDHLLRRKRIPECAIVRIGQTINRLGLWLGLGYAVNNNRTLFMNS